MQKAMWEFAPETEVITTMGIAAPSYEEIIATFTYKTFESADRSYCVFRFKNYDTHKEFTAIGSMLPNKKNLPVKLIGDWEINKKNGRKQFRVAFFEQAKPSGQTEVVAYFTALHCGIGGVKAKAIWKHFGNTTWDVIENTPERLLEVPMISRKILARFEEAQKENNMLRELLKLFAQSGSASAEKPYIP